MKEPFSRKSVYGKARDFDFIRKYEPIPEYCPVCGEALSIRDERGGYCSKHYWVVGSLPERLTERALIAERKLEDLRELLEGAAPLLKPHQKAMINWTPLKSYNRGYNKLKEELLAELERGEKK